MLFERQQYQQDCVDNIVRVLDAVDFANADYGGMKAALAALAEENVAYKQHELTGKPCLDVLMETGTGKTFVYLQTIFELNKRYKRNKFIIVLPRTAIKEGVMQNIRLTDEYFFNLYKKHLNCIDYPRDGLESVQYDFVKGDGLCVLVTTNSAFNSEKNNINKKTETLIKYDSTWAGIAAQKPVVIIDEPHLLKGGQTKKGLDKLTDSLFIRFGATYPTDEEHKLSNVVYMLNSIQAFNKCLVKRIGVSTVYAGRAQKDISVARIVAKEKRFDLCFSEDGIPRKVELMRGQDIGAKCGLADYNGIHAVKITAAGVRLNTGRVLDDKNRYELGDEETRLMIRAAVKAHFEKERALFEKRVKALTLFFIPSINDFRGDHPRIKTMFEEEYAALRGEYYQRAADDAAYRAYLDNDRTEDGVLRVHEGYFSGDKGTADERERAGVEVILRQKERLLSFEEPLRFVFSVWALQEGWDNPNIFTICKLAASSQENSRRQQVGRGLRLAVNQGGRRLSFEHLQGDENAFYDINTLDMVVPGQEQTFIHQIQSEISDASRVFVGDRLTVDAMKGKGLKETEAVLIYAELLKHGIISDADEDGLIQSPIIDFLRNNRALFPMIRDDNRYHEICRIFELAHRSPVRDNNKKRVGVNIRADKWEAFKTLWEQINRKAKITYRGINEDALIAQISAEFNAETIPALSASVVRKELRVYGDDVLIVGETSDENNPYVRVDMGRFAHRFMSQKGEVLPKNFVFKLFAKLDRQQFNNNPKRAEQALRAAIKRNIHAGVLHSVDYELIETRIYPNELQDAAGNRRARLDSTKLGMFTADGTPPAHFLYDKIVYDSEIEKGSIENDPHTVNDCAITVFAKLPKISIPTPYKNYNPDFAYLIGREGRKTLFLIVETKGYDSEQEIPEDERQKINYGRRFFECLNEKLPDVDVVYKTRINKVELSDLLREIAGG